MATLPDVGIKADRPGHGRTIHLELTDGTARTVDVTPLLRGPVFSEILADKAKFDELFVDQRFRTVCWPGPDGEGPDLAPEALAALKATDT